MQTTFAKTTKQASKRRPYILIRPTNTGCRRCGAICCCSEEELDSGGPA